MTPGQCVTQEWRFYFKGAEDDMVGCAWRDSAPTPAEVAEFREIFGGAEVWVEVCTVTRSKPKRAPEFDQEPAR